jgi:two-component system, sensor histidine kinase and response regulator
MNAILKLYNLALAFFKPLKEFVPAEYQSDFISATIEKNTKRTGFIIKLLLPLSIIMGVPDLINLILNKGDLYYNIAGISINICLFFTNIIFHYLFESSKKSNILRNQHLLLRLYIVIVAGTYLLYAGFMNSIIGDHTSFYIPLVLAMVIFVLPDYWQIYFSIFAALVLSICIYYTNDNYVLINNKLQVLIICTIVSMVFWWLERKHVATEFINEKMYEESKKSADLLNVSLVEKNSEIEEQNLELKELIATKDKFFSIIAHDIKNPLSAIVNLSAIISDMERFELSKDEIKEYSKNIHTATKNLNELLENLLVWSRSQRGLLKFSPESTNIWHLFEYISSLLVFAAAEKGIQISNEIPNDINIQIDANMLNTVFRNIINNAIKFTNNGGFIKAYLELISSPFDGFRIIIEDNGVGIPSENIDKLFNIQENITTQGTNNEIGTGLGLLICKEFVNKHNGNIYAKSKVGFGTKIMIELPK